MELWIRSQDKECLMKVERVDYDLSNSQHRIMVNGFETLVGIYETKERSLEVLDEIQDLKVSSLAVNLDYKSAIRNIRPEEANKIMHLIAVYEMPKE